MSWTSRLFALLDRRWVPLVLFGLTLAVLALGLTREVRIYDEGTSVYGAARVLKGEVPYRDFWTIYGPGQFYLLALVFKIFGTSLLIERIFATALASLFVLLVYVLARKVANPLASLISWVLMLAWLAPLGFNLATPLIPGLIFSLLSLWAALAYLEDSRPRSLFLAGLAAAGAGVFRHDLGFYTVAAESLLLIPFVLSRTRLQGLLRATGVYLGGLVVVLAPVAVLLVATVPLGDLAADLIVFPLTTYPKVRSLPYPWNPVVDPSLIAECLTCYAKASLERLGYLLPPAVIAAGLIVTALGVRRRTFRWDDPATWARLLLLAGAILYFNEGRFRALPTQLVPAMALVFVLVPVFVADLGKRSRLFALALSAFVAAAMLFPLYEKARLTKNLITRPAAFSFSLPRAGGISARRDSGYEAAIRFVRARVPEGDRIFVGNLRHDMVFVNDILFYFLSERHSATRYHELHPGLVTSETVQDEIVRDLERHRVRYLVLRDESAHTPEPNESGRSSGVTLLDDYIRSTFSPVEAFGDYSVWVRS